MTDETDAITETVKAQADVLYWRNRVSDAIAQIKRGRTEWQIETDHRIERLEEDRAWRRKWLDRVITPALGALILGLIAAVVYLIRATG